MVDGNLLLNGESVLGEREREVCVYGVDRVFSLAMEFGARGSYSVTVAASLPRLSRWVE